LQDLDLYLIRKIVFLLNAISQIREFLSKELKLILHPHKIRLQQVVKGFDFLGAHILPYDSTWEDAESNRSSRNALYVVGGVLLASGIGVHIFF